MNNDKCIKLADEKGYSHEYNNETGHSFRKSGTLGRRDIWRILTNRNALEMGWMTADVIDGYARNHKKYVHLENAINRPLPEKMENVKIYKTYEISSLNPVDKS